MTNTSIPQVSFRKVVTLFVLLELLIIAMGLWQHGTSLQGLQAITRFSGRLSLLLFSFIFLLHHKPHLLALWLSPQYYLLFAVVHGIHLIELVLFITSSDAHIIPVRLAGGALAYLFIFALPLMHNYHKTGKIKTATFKAVEVVYIYYLWFIFFMTYLPRVQGKLPHAGGSYTEHVVLLGWVSLLLGYKVGGILIVPYKKRGTSL